jgi:hypothetical protein
MFKVLRISALTLLIFSFTACPQNQTSHLSMPIIQDEPTPTPTPYEDPADCECYEDPATGRIICNSACSGRPKP